MSAIDTLLDTVAISLDNALYKGGFLVQSDGEARQIAKVALSAIESAGYRVVPVEPTEEMAEKARNAIYDSAPSKSRARSVYAAMLSAAPKITEGGE